MNLTEAQQFAAQLATFSQRVLKSLALPPCGSPHGDDAWSLANPMLKRAPIGAALHWTASDSLVSTVKWFCDPKSQVSSHVVVSDRRLEAFAEFASDLPLVQALPTTVVQMRGPQQTSWSVRGLNGVLYSIENVNVGQVSGQGNAQSWYNGASRQPYRSDKQSVDAFGRSYEPYTYAQLCTNIYVLRWVNTLHLLSLRPTHILGHSCFQGPRTNTPSEDKRDPGPLYPIHAIRYLVGEPGNIDLPRRTIDPTYARAWRAETARTALFALRGQQAKLSSSALADIKSTGDARAWAQFMSAAADYRSVLSCMPLADGMMACLGFLTTDTATQEEKLCSLKLCQRLLGLVQDGVLGPRTAQGLTLRFRDIFASS